MLARLSAFVIWALVAATAVFWGLRLFVRPSAPPPYAVAVGDASAMRGDLTRLLGSAPVAEPAATIAPEASARFQLLGIMAPKASSGGTSSNQGVALIAVDGNMPKAYAVGASLDGELVLQSVSLRSASIGGSRGGAAAITLELPPPAPAATGTLGGVGAPAAAPRGRPTITPQITPQFVPQYAPPTPQPAQPGRPEDNSQVQ